MRIRFLIGILIVFFLGLMSFWIVDSNDEVVDVVEVSFEEVRAIDSDEDNSLEVLDIPVVSEFDLEPNLDEVDSSFEQTEPSLEIPQSDTAKRINLAVPFTPQAPHANWDLPYQEACEEASAFMVWAYFNDYESGLIKANIADEEILKIVDYQNKTLGTYLDTNAQETIDFIQGFYGMNTYLVHDPTVEQIKEQIAKGYPVIVPTAGRELGNPNFSGEGPLYHMLVLRGYTESTWIVNDPGTRNGNAYIYNIDVIMNAIGDWNNGDPANGSKVVIFVEPN